MVAYLYHKNRKDVFMYAYFNRRDHIRTMSGRIKEMRKGLYERLNKLKTPGTWEHVINQIGMFSYTGLSGKHIVIKKISLIKQFITNKISLVLFQKNK